ncbi:MAG: TIM barrel protein [Pseudomonadota bacterium]
MTPKFSANLGFLWTDRPLADAIRAAHAAGFDAVECHWPYGEPVQAVRAALSETGLPMLGLNTTRGDVAGGENGLCGLPGREMDAQRSIVEAVEYADAIGAQAVHVMAGFATGEAAQNTFLSNLRFAVEQAADTEITFLIEPLNRYDAPGYFLQTCEQAVAIVDELGSQRVKLMFDCYHLQIMGGDLTRRLKACLPHIGHVQIAAVPDRGEPDRGELDYRHVLQTLQDVAYSRPIGAEYKPRSGSTDEGLAWMQTLRAVGA